MSQTVDNLRQDGVMATEVSASMCFQGTPAQVVQMLCDSTYLDLKCSESPEYDHSVKTEGDVTEILVTRVLNADLPDIARSLLGNQLSITEVQRWNHLDINQRATGTLQITIKGAPAQISGTLDLHECPTGTCIDVTAKISVAIPIFGSKAESFIAQEVTDICAHEESVGNKWLTHL